MTLKPAKWLRLLPRRLRRKHGRFDFGRQPNKAFDNLVLEGVKRLVGLLLAMASSLAWGDGIMLSPRTLDRPIEQPFQRAILKYESGVETLVIESFARGGEGEAAWLLPVPGKVLSVQSATTGTIETLETLTRPAVDDRPGWWWLAGAALFLIGVTLPALTAPRRASKGATPRVALESALVAVLALSAAAVVWPTFAAKGVHPTGAFAVGSYDARQFSGPVDLGGLAVDGFVLPPRAQQALQSETAAGWSVLAFKLRRGEHARWAPHPLMVTFQTDRPVYPMRLTMAVAKRVELDLLVIADRWAQAGGLATWWSGSPTEDAPTTDHLALSSLIPSGGKVTRLHGLVQQEGDLAVHLTDRRPAAAQLQPSQNLFAYGAAFLMTLAGVLLVVASRKGLLEQAGRLNLTWGQASGWALAVAVVYLGAVSPFAFVPVQYQLRLPRGYGQPSLRKEIGRLKDHPVVDPEQAIGEFESRLRAEERSPKGDVPGGYTVEDRGNRAEVTLYSRSGGPMEVYELPKAGG